MAVIPARPRPFEIDAARTALVVIDMQHEFLSPGGWIEAMGLDVGRLAPVIPVVAQLLAAARDAGITVIHTREGYRPDLADCPPAKRDRCDPPLGATGRRGRYMILGEPGHDIIPEVAPLLGEIVVDKPGAGAFHATLMDQILRLRGITRLLICGVTADVCVNATLYEANDRGYESLLISDATGSYDDFSAGAVVAIAANGVVGVVATADAVCTALASLPRITA